MSEPINFNHQGLGEEIANSISHGLGALLAIAGLSVLLVDAAQSGEAIHVVSASLYGFALIFLYLMSSIYHALRPLTAKWIFQKLDHCSIFLLIVGSYAPISLSLIRGRLGWTLFGLNLAIATAGIVANAVSVEKWHRLSLLLYLLMGWSVVIVIRPLMALVNFQGFLLLLLGGLCYTVGVLFYRAKRPRYMHAVWHLFVLAGSVLHYFFILIHVIPSYT